MILVYEDIMIYFMGILIFLSALLVALEGRYVRSWIIFSRHCFSSPQQSHASLFSFS